MWTTEGARHCRAKWTTEGARHCRPTEWAPPEERTEAIARQMVVSRVIMYFKRRLRGACGLLVAFLKRHKMPQLAVCCWKTRQLGTRAIPAHHTTAAKGTSTKPHTLSS